MLAEHSGTYAITLPHVSRFCLVGAIRPGIEYIWTEMANQVLGEDLRLVTGQQDRMQRGGRVWAHPVAYDKLGLHYRRWRNVMDGMNQDGCAVE